MLYGMFVLGAVEQDASNDLRRAYARLLSAANLTGKVPNVSYLAV